MTVPLRRLPPFLLVPVVLVALVVLAGPWAVPGRAAGPAAAPAGLPFLAGLPDVVSRTIVAIDRDVQRKAQTRRVSEARRLRRSRTPEAVVRRGWLLRLVDRPTYDAQRAVLARARRAAGWLPGARGQEQRAAVALVDRLAAGGVLTADRLRPVLLTLSRNTDWWTRRGAPAYGRSIVRGAGPITLRYVPGQGLVLHQLASWSLVDWLAGSCLRDRVHCPRRRLRAAVDTMMAMAVRRDGVVRAESYFRFGQASAPWISAMTQGSMIQALVRTSAVLHSAPDRRRARAALGAFTRPAPQGVSLPVRGGRHYLMYSTAPGLRVLNGDLHALTGLWDLATIGGSRAAARAFGRGERAARLQLRADDTGAWSRYSDGGAESSLSYHRLVTGFLGDLCDRHAGRRYCQAAARFNRYISEPTRVGLRLPRAPRAGSVVPLSVWLSKVSAVQLTVRDGRGRVVLQQAAQLPRGGHGFAWTVPRRGGFAVQVTAIGPGGPPPGHASGQVVARASLADVRRATRAWLAARALRAARAQRAAREGRAARAHRHGTRHP